MKQYIILARAPWQSVPTRTQQLVTRLSDAEVLFFEPYRSGKDYKNPGRQLRPTLTVYALPPPPTAPEQASFLFHRGWRRQADFIIKTMQRHGFEKPVLWTTAPEQVHLLDHLSILGLIYDCDKDWSRLPPRWEGDLTAAADVVFAASPNLVERLSPCNRNIALLPNGVNYQMFARVSAEIPPELKDLTGPILGWVGAITPDLDLKPIEYAAVQRPEWNFILVGPIRENARLPFLRTLSNVHLLGKRSIVEIPDYTAHFHVCLDLQRPGRDESDIIPRRIYEYLSTGKPIVAMFWPDQIEEFPDVIYGAHSPEEYEQLCQSALMEDPAWVSPRRRDYGAAAAWSRRAGEVCRILQGIGLY